MGAEPLGDAMPITGVVEDEVRPPVLHPEGLNGAEEGAQLVGSTGWQKYSQYTGIVIPKHHTVAFGVSHYQEFS